MPTPAAETPARASAAATTALLASPVCGSLPPCFLADACVTVVVVPLLSAPLPSLLLPLSASWNAF